MKQYAILLLLLFANFSIAADQSDLVHLKREVSLTKEVLTFGAQCFARAMGVKAASDCSSKMRKMAAERNVGGFEANISKRWGEREKAEVKRQIKEEIAVINCLLKAKTLMQASECD